MQLGHVRRLLAGVLVLAWPALAPVVTTAPQPTVLMTRVDGPITPVVANHLIDGVERTERDGHTAFLVRLDTPGGLDTSMRQIVQAFLGADVPVIVHVAPSGARAASAGALITLSAHIAAMAPGTTIGAATPVGPQGEELSDKITNDAAAYAISLAQQRGRDVTFAEDAVREGRAIPAAEAHELGVVDLVVSDQTDLLAAVDGQQVMLASGSEVTLLTRNAEAVEHDPGLFGRLLGLLADPNLAFLFLSLGTLAIIYELASPGVGLGGALGVILLILGFFALSVLPVNIAGLALLALAAALFVAEVLTPGVGVFAAGGSVALLLAGLFLFQGPVGVSPAVLWPTVAVIGGGTLVAGRLAWRARRSKPVSGVDLLVGQQTTIRRTHGAPAQVQLEGAWWTARPVNGVLQEGQTVRVIDVDGLELVVEPVHTTKEQQ